MRQAFAGLLWSKQFYHYDVARWLDGDPGQPPPPPKRKDIRNGRWRNFEALDIMSMPDTWEYPWFAAWDLAFQCVALTHVDPAFAKYQLSLLCREWFQHPNGALPAYEWDFSDVNPPVQAWAALEIFAIDGGRDIDFLSRIFDKLLVNFTWWVNREDADGSNLFEGGFMGLDNIGPMNRSHLPIDGVLEQSDATGWMATYALWMAMIATILHVSGHRPALDLVQKFLEHFAAIAEALDTVGVWDEEDGLFYDRVVMPDGSAVPLRVRSIAAVIPLLAVAVVDDEALDLTLVTNKRFASYLRASRVAATRVCTPAGSCTARRVSARSWSASPAATGCAGCARSCSTRTSSCRRTDCARCRRTTATIRTRSRCRACAQVSTTSPPSRPRRCSAGTRIGVGRCGFR